MRKCSKCHLFFPKSDFYGEYVYCKSCTRITNAVHKKKFYPKSQIKKQELINKLKINGCAICGYNKCNMSLDFHHVNPEDKEFRITKNVMDFKSTRIIKEINKCILLCKNCHFEIHQKEIL